MTNSSFAPNLADSGGASEDTFPSLRPPTTDPRPLTPDLRPPSSVLRPPASHLPPSTPRAIRAAAFSLVELLTVVGIIAILSVAAVPVMRGLGGSQSSRATAQILVSAFERARIAAITATNRESGWGAVVFPSTNSEGFPGTHKLRSYAIYQEGILISKWELLPGDLQFSPVALASFGTVNLSNTAVPGSTNWSGNLPAIVFGPAGGLSNTAAGVLTLMFASSNKVVNGMASVADRINISLYSGRVRYIGLTNNVEF